jgi:hypothetical protein
MELVLVQPAWRCTQRDIHVIAPPHSHLIVTALAQRVVLEVEPELGELQAGYEIVDMEYRECRLTQS